MKVLSVSIRHDASVCVMEDGKISYFMPQERISRKKYDYYWTSVFQDLFHNYDRINFSTDEENVVDKWDKSNSKFYDSINIKYDFAVDYKHVKEVENYCKRFFNYNELNIWNDNHHDFHAYGALYSSPFEEALCFVFDGSGSDYNGEETVYSRIHPKMREIESVYLKNSRGLHKVFKHYASKDTSGKDKFSHQYKNNLKISTELSVGWEFEIAAANFGFHLMESEKVMGLAQYKGHEEKLPEEYSDQNWKWKVDISSDLQKRSQEKILHMIKKYVNVTGVRNVVLTGGCAENCVANYYYLKNLPNINFYIDPLSSDVGLSVGMCIHSHLQHGEEKININVPYLCTKPNQGYNLDGLNSQDCQYEDVIDLILDQKVVAIFQGDGECGKRALGNRSLLFDPRNKQGKDIMNVIKKRENFRPFAGTVMLEHAHDWFEMLTLKESPYMLFAMDVKKDKVNQIPAIVHADDTCRIQTLRKDQNEHYYNLIDTFYKKTNVPILMNTSLNLAGEPLVQTFHHAIHTLKRSAIEYLYLPEIQKLVTVH